MNNAGMKDILTRSRPDMWAGIFFAVLGAAAFVFSLHGLRLGTPAHMGPGFFPAVVSAVVCLLGIVILLLSLGGKAAPQAEPENTRVGYMFATLGAILAAILAFALLLRPLGLVVSIFVLVIVARLVRWGSWREILTLGATLALIAYLIFVVGLNMPLRVVPW
jgi:hypothetical protein